MKLLVLSGDDVLNSLICNVLRRRNYICDCVNTQAELENYLDAFRYDLLILDLATPHFNGILFCQSYRRSGGGELVLLITMERDIDAQILGLNAGADDCLARSFTQDQMEAHVCALLRRRAGRYQGLQCWGKLCHDRDLQQIYYEKKPLVLTPKEYNLLLLFLDNPHQAFSLQSILDHAWPSLPDQPSLGTIKSHVRSLRKKFDQIGICDLIVTIYGLGYRLNLDCLNSLDDGTCCGDS